MAEFRDFDAEVEEVEGEPIRFRLDGFDFECVHPIPVGMAVVIAGKMDDDEIVQLAATGKAIRGMVIPSQRNRFDLALMTMSSMEKIRGLMEWIMESATGRPTSGSSSSPEHSASGGPSTPPESGRTEALPSPLGAYGPQST